MGGASTRLENPCRQPAFTNTTAAHCGGTGEICIGAGDSIVSGAITHATQSIYAVDSPLSGQPHAVDLYVFTARLDDRHVITVTSSASPRDSKATAEQAQHLLISAVDVVRPPS